jgi:outer membrane receptor for ferrienterochelin and colicin
MRKTLLTLALLLVSSLGLLAQVTTSSLTGTVKDQNNSGIPGANIVAVHEPSGTTYGTVSLPDGKFTIPNMRVGGPYKVTISFIGYETQSYSEIFLKLGEPYALSHQMKETGTQLEEIIVSGVEDKMMSSNRTGAMTNINTRQILAMPTIQRSINDITRLTPQATSTANGAIGGGNYRQNYITIDGSDFNNTFGIGTNLPAGGSPISLDAIEEISVNIAPFDVRQSGFVGSAVNAVTRAGTNDFQGSAYTFFRNQNQQGGKVGDNPPITKQDLQVNTYGFRLGGPIIKNKLFFFVNAEMGNEKRPGQLNHAATSSDPFNPANSPNTARPLASDLDTYSTYLMNTYGYETGPYQDYDFVSDNTRLLGRIDWNINNDHRLTLRYSQVESKSPNFPSTSRSPMAAFSQTRTSIYALPYKNSLYYQEANFYSMAAEMNSVFAGKYSNTFRATYTQQNDPRSTESTIFPFVDILQPDGANTNVPYTSFGYELFSYGNLRDVKSFSVVDYVAWSAGKHDLTAGFQFDMQSTKNGFQRFGTGYYTFASWNDFVTGQRPRDYALTYSLLPGYEQAFPRFKFAQYALYAQDEITISEKLRLTAGVRLELPTYVDVDEIKTHPLVAPLTFSEGRTVDTGVLPKNSVMFSPRVGFNYDVKGDRSLQLRGGTGVFTGRVPTVWIVAQSGDAGLLQFTQTYVGQANTPGPFQIDPYLPATQPAAGTQVPSIISATDPEFRFPQTWKTNLAADARLPWGVIGTFEGIFNKDLNIAKGENVNLVDPQPLNVSGYPDNRMIYPDPIRNKFINPLTSATFNATTNPNPNTPVPNGDVRGTQAFNPVVLSNGNEGYYWSLTGRLEKQFDKGLGAMIAYTQSQSKVLYDGSGDQLLNTWSLTQIVNEANNPELSYANYVVPSRFIGALSYRKEWLKNFATSIALFYEGSISGRYSYTYSSDFNRDGQTNDLIYVPASPSEITFATLTTTQVINGVSTSVTYTPQQQSDMFFAFIEQDDYLKTRKGQYAERNGAKFPWRNQLDLKFSQDIFTNIAGRKNTLQFTLDIFNFGNLLNKDWGIFKQINSSAILAPANTAALVPGGTVVPTFRMATIGGVPVSETFRDNNSITSTYYMQFGLRYIFN